MTCSIGIDVLTHNVLATQNLIETLFVHRDTFPKQPQQNESSYERSARVFVERTAQAVRPAELSHIVGLNTGRRSYFMKSEIIAGSCAP